LIALQSKDQSNVQLKKKALKLYKLSFELDRNEQASRLSTLFYMATISNSGQIYRLLGEQELAAGTCSRNLLSTAILNLDIFELS
jgi:hypothetical protein